MILNYAIYSDYGNPETRSFFALFHPKLDESAKRIMGKTILSSGRATISKDGSICCTPSDGDDETKRLDESFLNN